MPASSYDWPGTHVSDKTESSQIAFTKSTFELFRNPYFMSPLNFSTVLILFVSLGIVFQIFGPKNEILSVPL